MEFLHGSRKGVEELQSHLIATESKAEDLKEKRKRVAKSERAFLQMRPAKSNQFPELPLYFEGCQLAVVGNQRI